MVNVKHFKQLWRRQRSILQAVHCTCRLQPRLSRSGFPSLGCTCRGAYVVNTRRIVSSLGQRSGMIALARNITRFLGFINEDLVTASCGSNNGMGCIVELHGRQSYLIRLKSSRLGLLLETNAAVTRPRPLVHMFQTSTGRGPSICACGTASSFKCKRRRHLNAETWSINRIRIDFES